MENPKIILLISGPIAVGKSAVRDELVAKHVFTNLRSSEYLRSEAQRVGLSNERIVLQKLGDDLDEKTDFRWLIDAVAIPAMSRAPGSSNWVVDAVRKKRQIEHFRDVFGGVVFHVHFIADEAILMERYLGRQRLQGISADPALYENAINHENERAARSLGDVADMLIDLGGCSADSATEKIMRALNDRLGISNP